MSAAAERSRAVHCRLCPWRTTDPDPAAREQQWQAHYYGLHPQPIETRCTVPPYCGWTITAPDLTTLRLLKAEHEATHNTTRTRQSHRQQEAA